MSLYLNNEVEPKVGLSPNRLSDNNQEVYRLHFLAEIIKQQEIINHKMTDSLDVLNQSLEKVLGDKQEIAQLVGKEELIHQTILAQLSTHENQTMNLINKINQLENELSEQIKQHQNTHIDIASKLDVQDVYHQTVMERLDQQEANAFKIIRQLDHIKSIFFERIAHLADKIEIQSKQTIKSLTGLFVKQEELNVEELKDDKTEKLTVER
jgi:hypothetical protein